MKPRFVYVHGNETTHWSFAWAKWLKQELDTLGYETFFETMPDSINTRSKYWLPFLKDHVSVGPNDVIIGWSSGAVAAMRYAEQHPIKGSVLISPCYTDLDGDPLEVLSGFYNTPWNWEAIKQNQGNIALFWGDNDPYIPQSEFYDIAGFLNPKQFKIAGRGHFVDDTTFPELLEYLKETYPL